jgi:uncharacterized protein YndB with AHSA1/START domain
MVRLPDARRGNLLASKSKRQYPSFHHSLVIAASPARVQSAFFDPVALAVWWQAVRSVTTPRLFGAFAVEWETTDYRDEILGALGGTFHGTVVEYKPGHEFFVADAFWVPPEGDPIGPMALEVVCEPHLSKHPPAVATLLRVAQRGYEESERWSRYYDVINTGWVHALETLKAHLEQDAWRG